MAERKNNSDPNLHEKQEILRCVPAGSIVSDHDMFLILKMYITSNCNESL